MFVDYYEILEITINASESEIKNAFRKQAIKWHPDKNNGKDTTQRMQLINEAYLILKDKEARTKYDYEYKEFKKYQETEQEPVNEEDNFTYTDYVVQDDILNKWMQNARKQAVDLAKQTIKDFKDIGLAGAKAAAKESGSQLVAHIIIAIVAVIIFSIVGKCN
jgi:DnaJ-class molecular chaperone